MKGSGSSDDSETNAGGGDLRTQILVKLCEQLNAWNVSLDLRVHIFVLCIEIYPSIKMYKITRGVMSD